ncbi:MAG: P1 family peptidase [Actinomycetota bacterium]
MSDPHPAITNVPGVEVGHWTDPDARTGATVVTFPPDNRAAGEIRGAFPAEREFASLASGTNVDAIEAVIFAGGSARGLAAADGVVTGLGEDGVGAETPGGAYLQTVVGAVVYDLGVGDPLAFPGPAEGLAAYRARERSTVIGAVGAGAGATAAKWRGPEETLASGVGTWSVTVDGATVGALVVANPVGDVFSLEGDSLTGGPPVPSLHPAQEFGARQNTTLAAIATDARLDRPSLLRLLVRVHDAYGATLRPAHTRWDGDAAVAVSCGDVDVHPDAVNEAAFIAMARAIESVFRLPAG